MPLETPPVLCDLDDDGLHDIILPDLDEPSGLLLMHVLAGDGSFGPGHGTSIPAPSGGGWLRISDPVVAGRYGTGDLRVSVTGLVDNGLTGTEARWSLGLAFLLADGYAPGPALARAGYRRHDKPGCADLAEASSCPTPWPGISWEAPDPKWRPSWESSGPNCCTA